MPPISPTLTTILNTTRLPSAAIIGNLSASPLVANTTTTTEPLQVICAWPVSGQYGIGSRVLYYILVAACVFARKAEWLRNACLAAALLFPAVAALHSIVLAATHIQGLLSLAIAFFRIKTFPCTEDDAGNPILNDPDRFPYNQATCGMICSVEEGPYSSLRRGSADDIYVIPAPSQLRFGTATFLAAACCIPAILSLVSMWNKILEVNWKSRFGDADIDEPIEGTNGATVGGMKGVNNMIRSFLTVVEIPIFTGAVLTILVIGERNFFSSEVNYQTEPLASIGQWAPIVGTILAALGSGYIWVAADVEAIKEEVNSKHAPIMYHCNCSGRQSQGNGLHLTDTGDEGGVSRGGADVGPDGLLMTDSGSPDTPASGTDAGNRLKVAKMLIKFGKILGTAQPGLFDDSEFKNGKALDFPLIPGEEGRNPVLPLIQEIYNSPRDEDGKVTPTRGRSRPRSGTGSSAASTHFSPGATAGGSNTNSSTTLFTVLPPSPQPPYSAAVAIRARASTVPTTGSSLELTPRRIPLDVADTTGHRLQVPPTVHHHNPSRMHLPIAVPDSSDMAISAGRGSPAIVVSPVSDTGNVPLQMPVSHPYPFLARLRDAVSLSQHPPTRGRNPV